MLAWPHDDPLGSWDARGCMDMETGLGSGSVAGPVVLPAPLELDAKAGILMSHAKTITLLGALEGVAVFGELNARAHLSRRTTEADAALLSTGAEHGDRRLNVACIA